MKAYRVYYNRQDSSVDSVYYWIKKEHISYHLTRQGALEAIALQIRNALDKMDTYWSHRKSARTELSKARYEEIATNKREYKDGYSNDNNEYLPIYHYEEIDLLP